MMNDQDQINEEERLEAATETPAFLGCPQHMPVKLPSGFDGAEPAPSDEAKKALADGVERMRDKLSKIADIALAADAKCVNIEKIDKRWMECSKAICEIRKICGPDLIEKAVFSTGMYYTPGWLANLAKYVEARQKPLDPTAPEMERGKGRLFKSKQTSSCRGTYIYDRVVINGAHLRANLHYDNGGLEQHGSVYVDDSPRAFCFVTFNTPGATKCDYAMRGLLAGLAKRLVYHHKNLIKRKAKWAAAKAAKEVK